MNVEAIAEKVKANPLLWVGGGAVAIIGVSLLLRARGSSTNGDSPYTPLSFSGGVPQTQGETVAANAQMSLSDQLAAQINAAKQELELQKDYSTFSLGQYQQKQTFDETQRQAGKSFDTANMLSQVGALFGLSETGKNAVVARQKDLVTTGFNLSEAGKNADIARQKDWINYLMSPVTTPQNVGAGITDKVSPRTQTPPEKMTSTNSLYLGTNLKGQEMAITKNNRVVNNRYMSLQ